MKKKILITPRSFSQAGEKTNALLREYNYEIIVNSTGLNLSEEQMVEMCADINGLIVGIDPITEKVLRSARNLKAISKYGAGIDNIDMKIAKELGIKVDKALGSNATSVAELAIGCFFVLARAIPFALNSTKKGGWDRIKGVELAGKTVGIMGLGNIGREVARISHGLGMQIIAYDPFLDRKEKFLMKYNVSLLNIESLFKNSDFISLHLPLTDETKHIINERTITMMKSGVYIINTSRGQLVDEDALYEALKSGKIAGAAEDVFSKEPPGDHKLLSLDNFILTPHIGAFTTEANEKMALQSVKNLIRMLEEK